MTPGPLWPTNKMRERATSVQYLEPRALNDHLIGALAVKRKKESNPIRTGVEKCGRAESN